MRPRTLPVGLQAVARQGQLDRLGVEHALARLRPVAVVPEFQPLVVHAGPGPPLPVLLAQRAHLVLGEPEEALVERVVHGAVLVEHVEVGPARVRDDGHDARHVGHLHVLPGLQELLEEHEEGALVGLREHLVEEHRVPLVHDEHKPGPLGLACVLESAEQVALSFQPGLRPRPGQLGEDALADSVDVVVVSLAPVRKRAEVDADHVVGAEVRHGPFVARDLEALEERSRVQPPREEAREHVGVHRLAEAARARDADVLAGGLDGGRERRHQPRLVHEVRRASQLSERPPRVLAVEV